MHKVKRQNIEAIYPLTSTQEGMLFHSMYAGGSGVYFQQTKCTFEGRLDVPAFRRAWQHVVNRHQVLRTGFNWQLKRKPLQIVRRQVELPWEELDQCALSAVEQEEALQQRLRTYRKQGFDLTQPPLMRCLLIRSSPQCHDFIWSYHHIILDGWSVSLLLKEVFTFYEAFRRGANPMLEEPRPFQDHVAWLKQRDVSAAEKFWRDYLAGFEIATPLDSKLTQGPVVGDEETEYGVQQLHLSAATSTMLEEFARRSGVTRSVLVEGVWALLLSRYSGEKDVV